MDEDEDGAYGPIDEDGSGTGYESASDASLSIRRKKESSDEDNRTGNKKLKKEQRNTNDKKTDKYAERKKTKDLPDDGWIQNKIHKTFFMEPTDEKQKLHIMEIAKLLHNIKITNYNELKPAGKFRYKITFNNPRHAENLINSKILTETYKYKIYVPKMFQETIGVVRNIPPTITEEELQDNIESKRIKITKVERIHKMVNKQLIPTYSIKIYAEGEKLPQEIKIYGVMSKVEVYLFPLKFCWKCLRYGHKQNACKSQQVRCYNCSQNDHEGKDCKSLNVSCFHCKEPHKAFDANCKERSRQDNIRKSMAYNKLSFAEAEKLNPRPSQTAQRLQSLTDFPPITTDNDINNKQQPKPQNKKQIITNTQNNINTNKEVNNDNYITKPELEQIVNKLKVEIVKQLNLNKLINKIKEIQEKINENVSNEIQTNSKDQNLFLINISEQLNDLINPEILQPPKPPYNK